MSKINMIDLFSGAGGLSYGFSEASPEYTSIAAVENNKYAASTFSLNFPETDIFVGDIREWAKKFANNYSHEIDVIIGGPPCQGFSTLGKRNIDDSRNSLWENYIETIKIIKPKYFVMENVAIFLKSKEYKNFLNEVNSSLEMKDYVLIEHVINAADYGAPQNRKRAIVIGYRKNYSSPKIPEPTHSFKPTINQQRIRTIGEIFENIPLVPDRDDTIDGRSIVFQGMKIPGSYTLRDTHWSRNYSSLSLDRFSSIPPGGNRFDLPDGLKAPCWLKHKSGATDVMGRLHIDQPSVTIRTEFFKPEKGRYLHPTENRAITHFEAGKIQGFPANYMFAGSKTEIAKQIGNAVPIKLGEMLGSTILKALHNEHR